MKNRRVVITGMGTVNPLAHNVEDTWRAMLEGRSAIGKTFLFDASTYPTTFSAQVKDYDLARHLPTAEKHRHVSRHGRFALGAAHEAWMQSGLEAKKDLDRTRLGLYLGSGEGSLDFDNFISTLVDSWRVGRVDTKAWADAAFARMDLFRETEQESNMVLSHLAGEFGAMGPAFNVLTACAASTQAIGEAALLVRRGDVDVVITGGAHSMIHPFGVTGFNRLTALSVRNDQLDTACRPFDATRDGFVLGEGSSILVLEDYEFAKARGAKMLAEIVGYGASADAFRITDQDSEGDGAASSMRGALADAGMTPEQIDYISAHGTGTKQNDQVETRGVKAVFCGGAGSQPVPGQVENLPHPRVPPMSSVKSMVGHLIAAAGATELITCVLALRDQIVPPTINYQHADPDCDLDYVPNKARKAKVDVCMSNSFGFGGQNNTLILTRAS